MSNEVVADNEKKSEASSSQETEKPFKIEDNRDQEAENQTTTEENGVKESEKQFMEENRVQYDELLSSAGEFGLYQVLLLLGTLPFYMFGVYSYYSQIFLTEMSTNHWCWIPELENLTYIERRNLAIPSEDSIYGYSRCTTYVANWTEVLETGQVPDETWEIEPCQHGWEFDASEIPYPTIGSELGWVCDKSSYQATAQSLFSVGSIFGCLLFGWMSDRYGRIPAAVTANLFGFVGGTASSFTNSFVSFTICRFIMGMSYDSNMVIIYVLVLEFVAPKYRSLMANVSFAVFYTLFVTTLPFMALALAHWKLIALVTSVPFAIAIFTPLFMPESPRWLLSKGRIDDTIKKVLMIGRVNKKVVPPKLIEQFKWTMSTAQKEENLNFFTIFKRPVLRKGLLLMCLEYMCCILVFDGLLRNIGYLDYDFFVSFALISVTELPSMLLLAFVLDILGRRWLTLIVMSVSALFTFLTISATTGAQSVAYVVVARFGVNMSYGAILQWAAEIMPTGVRGSGVSFVHICGFVALAISPYIVILSEIAFWLPLTVIGLISTLGAVLPLFLPETARKEMPHTFEDAEELMIKQQFCEMPCVKKQAESSEMEEYVNQSFERDST